MSVNIQNLRVRDGANNDAGIKVDIAYIPYSWIKTWPTTKDIDNANSFGELVRYYGNFELHEGKYWSIIESTMHKGILKSTLAGERDGRSAENDLEFVHPGNEDYLLGFIEYFKNTRTVLAVRERDKTEWRIVGSDGLPATLKTAEITTGGEVKDLKHAKMSFDSAGRIAKIYSGTIAFQTQLNITLDFTDGSTEYVEYGNQTYAIPVNTADASFFVYQNGRPLHKVVVTGGDLPTGLTASIVGGKIAVEGTPTQAGIYGFTLVGQITVDGTATGAVKESDVFEMTIVVTD